MVLVMSVNPGFGGQELIPTSLAKLRKARAFLPATVALEVDGGVDSGNIASLVEAGANVLVAGSSVFSTGDPAERFRELQAAGAAQ
jgi:ribulose-phosphate 3-epimerase